MRGTVSLVCLTFQPQYETQGAIWAFLDSGGLVDNYTAPDQSQVSKIRVGVEMQLMALALPKAICTCLKILWDGGA